MPVSIDKDTAAQALTAFSRGFSADKPGPSRLTSGLSRTPLDRDYGQDPGLIEVDFNVLAARLRTRRDGTGSFRVLAVVHPKYREAVCYSPELPFAVEPGQKVRVVGRQGEYQGKPQIIFQPRNISASCGITPSLF